MAGSKTEYKHNGPQNDKGNFVEVWYLWKTSKPNFEAAGLWDGGVWGWAAA